jgi:hypothetical protein
MIASDGFCFNPIVGQIYDTALNDPVNTDFLNVINASDDKLESMPSIERYSYEASVEPSN